MAENKNAQQVREITDKLEQGIKELFESERFKEYLRTMSKFYNYSFNNTLLIAMQKPEATYVAGYTSWQRNFANAATPPACAGAETLHGWRNFSRRSRSPALGIMP